MPKKPDALTLEIADRLRGLREKRYPNQKEFAKISGISLSYVRKIESAGSSPTVKKLHAYLQACDYSMADFFEKYTRPGNHAAEDKYIQKRIGRIMKDNGKRPHLLQYLDLLDPNS